jgi:hypothetical protein
MPLHVSDPFVAHHQEAECIMWRPGHLTFDLEVKQVPFATLYTLPPDDGPQMGPKHVEAW